MSSQPPKTISTKGKRAKTKAGRTMVVDSSSSKLPVQRVRTSTRCTHPLDPSSSAAGEVGFTRRFERAIDRNCFFNKCFNRRKVIVERAITLLDFSSRDFAFISQIFESRGWLPFTQLNLNLL
jgi:hypothetical protein